MNLPLSTGSRMDKKHPDAYGRKRIKPLETKGKLLTNVRMCGILKVEIVKSTIDIS
jgi:hypothetical protein